MKMTRNFARLCSRERLMPECQSADGDFGRDGAAEPCRRVRIVIARDPNPLRVAHVRFEFCPRAVIEPLGCLAIMKGVSQRDDTLRWTTNEDVRNATQR